MIGNHTAENQVVSKVGHDRRYTVEVGGDTLTPMAVGFEWKDKT